MYIYIHTYIYIYIYIHIYTNEFNPLVPKSSSDPEITVWIYHGFDNKFGITRMVFKNI